MTLEVRVKNHVFPSSDDLNASPISSGPRVRFLPASSGFQPSSVDDGVAERAVRGADYGEPVGNFDAFSSGNSEMTNETRPKFVVPARNPLSRKGSTIMRHLTPLLGVVLLVNFGSSAWAVTATPDPLLLSKSTPYNSVAWAGTKAHFDGVSWQPNNNPDAIVATGGNLAQTNTPDAAHSHGQTEDRSRASASARCTAPPPLRCGTWSLSTDATIVTKVDTASASAYARIGVSAPQKPAALKGVPITMTVSWPGNVSLTNGDADPIEGLYAVAITTLRDDEFNAEFLSLVGYSDKDKFQLSPHGENPTSKPTPVKWKTPKETFFKFVLRLSPKGFLTVENSGTGTFQPLRSNDFTVSPCVCKGTKESAGKMGGHEVEGCFEVRPATTIMRDITIIIPNDDDPLSVMLEEMTGQKPPDTVTNKPSP